MNGVIPSTLALTDREVFLFLALAVIGAVVLLYSVGSVRRIFETRAREQTRREVAAYVAEGSITSSEAVKLLGSGTEEAERMIADAVAWGTIKPEKAQGLIRALRNEEPARA